MTQDSAAKHFAAQGPEAKNSVVERAASALLDLDGNWRPCVIEWRNDGRAAFSLESPEAGLKYAGGVVTGGFTDWHVHTALFEPDLLAVSALTRVLDLGSNPEHTAQLSIDNVEVQFAGAFLTAPGGYPSERSWASEGSFRCVDDADSAAEAVREMASYGARMIKIASNIESGPVLSDELFTVIVKEAEGLGLPVVAHAEGHGEAMRVCRLGAKYLAHTPFTEPLSDTEIEELAEGIACISTLDIHGWGDPSQHFDIALENLGRFHSHGGRVLYGSDMGNGPTPIGLNSRELFALAAAGLNPAEKLAALTPGDPMVYPVFVPGDSVEELHLAAATPLAETGTP